MGFTTTVSKRLILATAIAGLFGTIATPAFADMETLLDKLHEKGVLSDEDYQQMRTEARAERRAQALKEASDTEKSAKAKDESATTMTGRFKDGVSWESGDKSTAFSVNGRVQGDYRMFQGNTAPNTFDVRRAYLGAKGKFYNDITFNVTGDFAQSSGNAGAGSTAIQLDEAYMNFGWIKWAQVRVGQFQMPFSLEKITSDLFNNFQERFIGDTMSPDKLRGLQVGGSPTPGLYYAVAVANGNGAKNTNDVNNTVDGKEGIGRVAVNFAEMFSAPNAVYHIGASYSDTTQPVASATAFSGRTEARGVTFFSASPFTGSNVGRQQNGLETAVAYGPVKLQAESVTSSYSGTSALGVGYDKDIKTYYASLVWMITGEPYSDAYANSVFTRIRPKSNFTANGGGWGAWELGVRFSKWDAGDFRTGGVGTGILSSANVTSEADAMTVGLKWIPNPNTRVLLNYIRTKFDTPVTVAGVGPFNDEKAVTMRAQFDF
jgi:phosphate-selective porin OprO/OprP